MRNQRAVTLGSRWGARWALAALRRRMIMSRTTRWTPTVLREVQGTSSLLQEADTRWFITPLWEVQDVYNGGCVICLREELSKVPSGRLRPTAQETGSVCCSNDTRGRARPRPWDTPGCFPSRDLSRQSGGANSLHGAPLGTLAFPRILL